MENDTFSLWGVSVFPSSVAGYCGGRASKLRRCKPPLHTWRI